MAGKILVNVLTLEKEGLVGVTEIGEEIPLRKTGEGPLKTSQRDRYLEGLSDEQYVFFIDVSQQESKSQVYLKR